MATTDFDPTHTLPLARPGGAVAFSPDGRRLAVQCANYEVRVIDVDAVAEVARVPGHPFGACWDGIAWSPDGRWLAVKGPGRNEASVWDAEGTAVRVVLRGHADLVHAVRFSADGRWLATAGDDGTARLWDPGSGRCRAVMRLPNETQALNVAFSPDGRWLATGGLDTAVRLHALPDGEVGPQMLGHGGGVRALAFTSDGRFLLSGASDGEVRAWSLTDFRAEIALRGHDGSVLGIAASPDGRLAATAGRDKTVRVWDLASRQALRVHTTADWVWSVDFSPDGRWLAAGCGDRALRLWDTRPLGIRPSSERVDQDPLPIWLAGQKAMLEPLAKVWPTGGRPAELPPLAATVRTAALGDRPLPIALAIEALMHPRAGAALRRAVAEVPPIGEIGRVLPALARCNALKPDAHRLWPELVAAVVNLVQDGVGVAPTLRLPPGVPAERACAALEALVYEVLALPREDDAPPLPRPRVGDRPPAGFLLGSGAPERLERNVAELPDDLLGRLRALGPDLPRDLRPLAGAWAAEDRLAARSPAIKRLLERGAEAARGSSDPEQLGAAVGGVTGVDRKGDWRSLLHTQLVLPRDELMRRFHAGGLLFRGREQEPPPTYAPALLMVSREAPMATPAGLAARTMAYVLGRLLRDQKVPLRVASFAGGRVDPPRIVASEADLLPLLRPAEAAWPEPDAVLEAAGDALAKLPASSVPPRLFVVAWPGWLETAPGDPGPRLASLRSRADLRLLAATPDAMKDPDRVLVQFLGGTAGGVVG